MALQFKSSSYTDSYVGQFAAPVPEPTTALAGGLIAASLLLLNCRRRPGRR